MSSFEISFEPPPAPFWSFLEPKSDFNPQEILPEIWQNIFQQCLCVGSEVRLLQQLTKTLALCLLTTCKYWNRIFTPSLQSQVALFNLYPTQIIICENPDYTKLLPFLDQQFQVRRWRQKATFHGFITETQQKPARVMCPTFVPNIYICGKGKHYFEVQLLGTACVKVGWVTLMTNPVGTSLGIGSDLFSWGYDGLRQLKLGSSEQSPLERGFSKAKVARTKPPGSLSHPYGKLWKGGDIVGCCLDLRMRTISWTLNGESLGIGFTFSRVLKVFTPAVTLLPVPQSEKKTNQLDVGGVEWIFEANRMKYIPLSYRPIEAPPKDEVVFSIVRGVDTYFPDSTSSDYSGSGSYTDETGSDASDSFPSSYDDDDRFDDDGTYL